MTGRTHDMRYSCFLPWWYEILLLWSYWLAEVPQGIRNTEWLERFRWESIFGDEERLCMYALLWKVKVDSYRKFFNTCRGTILSLVSATIEWLISVASCAFFFIRNLRQIVRNFRQAECACDRCWRGWKRLAPLRYLGSALRQIARDFRKAEFACDGC